MQTRQLFQVVTSMLVTAMVTLACDQTNYGDLWWGAGNSNIPVYARGFGPHQRWGTGVDATVNWCGKIQLDVFGSLYGAALFDNPERTEFGFGLYYRLSKKWKAGVYNWNLMSLNAMPVIDTAARTKTSSINQTTFIISRDFHWENLRLTATYGHGFRGDEPVWFPTASTRPYMSHVMTAAFRYDLGAWKLWARPELYSTEKFMQNRTSYFGGVDRGLFGNRIFLMVEGVANMNWDVPAGEKSIVGKPLRNSTGILLGFRIPIGKEPL